MARPLSDPHRLAAVRRILSGGTPEGLDRLTGLAALLLHTPHAQVSLLTDEQLVSAAYGLTPAQRSGGPLADSLCTVTAELAGPLAVEDAAADDRVRTLPPVTAGVVGAYLGVPLVDRAGLVLGALCVFDGQPRPWTATDVGVLSELALSVVAELELLAVGEQASADAARLELTMSAAGAGAFDWHLDTGRLTWDDTLLELFGYTDPRGEPFDDTIDSFRRRLHPDDVERTAAAIDQAVLGGQDFAAEYRIVRPDASVRRIVARGRVVGVRRGSRGRLLGVAYDSTELLDVRDRLAQVLATMSDACFSVDRSWRLTWVNAEAERLLGRPAGEVLGRTLWDARPGLAGSPTGGSYREALEQRQPVRFEEQTGGRTYEVRAWPQHDGGLAVSLLDLTDRRRAEDERERASREREQAVVERERAYAAAEAASHRLTLLADATTRLSSSLDAQQVLHALADTVVPELGAWMAVVMPAALAGGLRAAAPDDGPLPVVLARHGQDARSAELAQVLGGLRLDPSDERGPGAVLRTGRPDWVAEPDALLWRIEDPHARERLRELGVGPSMTVPLASRGRRLATLTVVAPPYGVVDRALLSDLAGRAAVALDNALLYADERRTGLTLQRSLLPRDLPQLPDLPVAARYLPGAEGAFVGGDWYQGIPVDGRLVLAIGDVMGHGMRSAARMGQLRAIVATLALEGHGPGQLLSRLSGNVHELLDLELATLLVASYDPRARTLHVASAGHPPALHVPAGGEPAYLDVEPGPPLGTFAGTFPETVVTLAPHDTVVLFTDGLVETRDDDLDAGLERLRTAVRHLHLPPEQVADHVLRTSGVTRGGADDVAVLVFAHGATLDGLGSPG